MRGLERMLAVTAALGIGALPVASVAAEQPAEQQTQQAQTLTPEQAAQAQAAQLAMQAALAKMAKMKPAIDRSGIYSYTQFYDPDLGPSNQVVADINAAFGTSFADWSGEKKGRVGGMMKFPYTPKAVIRVFGAFTPLEGEIGGNQTVTGAFGPQTGHLDWTSRNYQLGVGYERFAVFNKHPDVGVGADIFGFYVKSHVKSGLDVPAAGISTSTNTEFSDASIGYRAFVNAPVGSVFGHKLYGELGHEWAKVSGSASGTTVNPGLLPGDTTAVPARFDAKDNFNGFYFSINAKW